MKGIFSETALDAELVLKEVGLSDPFLTAWANTKCWLSTEFEPLEFGYGADVDSGNSTNHSPNEDKNISQATEGKLFYYI